MPSSRSHIEQPTLQSLSDLDPNDPPQQRTTEQQSKQINLIAQQRRDAGLETNRSRSSSRRDRRRRIRRQLEDGRHLKTGSLAALEEADANGDLQAMRPFERIGPDSTSMDGPVTDARARRGEIPVRGSNPRQPYYMTPEKEEKGSQLKDTEGLKLSLEANLDIEIELKREGRTDEDISDSTLNDAHVAHTGRKLTDLS